MKNNESTIVTLLEKVLRKIVREELEYYTEKIIKEVAKPNNIMNEESQRRYDVQPHTKGKLQDFFDNVDPMSIMKSKLQPEQNKKITFENMEVPPELDKVFNRDYSQVVKKITK